MKMKEIYEQYLEHLHKIGRDPKTIREHERFLYGPLSHSVQDKEISDLRLSDRDLVIQAGSQHGKHGSQRAVVTFRQVLKYLQELGYSLPIDWRDLQVPQVPQAPVEFLTLNEFDKIRSALKNDLPGLRTRALIELIYDTGLRPSEAVSLDKKDIDWEQREIKVLNCKSKKWETVFLTARSIYWLQKYLEARTDTMPYLFVSGRGRLLTVTSRNYIRTHLSGLGINKHIKHYIWRKTYITTLVHGGVNIKFVKDLSRHADERTTLRYYTGSNMELAKEKHQEVMNNV